MSSPDATWRVYLAEWLIVYTSDSDGPEGVDECWDHFARKYKGRMREDDRRVVPAIVSLPPGLSPSCVQLKLPNLKGEFKDYLDADGLADEFSGSAAAAVVRRGSAEERELLDYGRKMLPGAG